MGFDMEKLLKVFKDIEEEDKKRKARPKKEIKRVDSKHPWEKLSEDKKDMFLKEAGLEWCCEQRKEGGVIRNRLTVYYEVWEVWKEKGE